MFWTRVGGQKRHTSFQTWHLLGLAFPLLKGLPARAAVGSASHPLTESALIEKVPNSRLHFIQAAREL